MIFFRRQPDDRFQPLFPAPRQPARRPRRRSRRSGAAQFCAKQNHAAHLDASGSRRLARQDVDRLQGHAGQERARRVRGTDQPQRIAVQAGNRARRDGTRQPGARGHLGAGHRQNTARILNLHRGLPDPRPRPPTEIVQRSDRRRDVQSGGREDGCADLGHRLPRQPPGEPARSPQCEDAGRPQGCQAAHARLQGVAVPGRGARRHAHAAGLWRGLPGPEDRHHRRPGQPASIGARSQVLRGHQADRHDQPPDRRHLRRHREHENRIKEEAQLVDFFKKEGLQVSTPDVEAFRKTVQAAYQNSEYAKVWPKGLVDRINAVK